MNCPNNHYYDLYLLAVHLFIERKYIYLARAFFFNFIYFQRGGRREKHQCVIASQVPLTGDLAHNLRMCPDWELNQRLCGLQSGAQSTEPGLLS